VLVARQLEGMSFGLGSTLAFPRSVLEEIGGFIALADYLADDYELGHRIARTGRKIELSTMVVETHLPPYRFGQFLLHQLRWARTIRNARGKGYLGLVFTFGIFWALLGLAVSAGASWMWMLLFVVLGFRAAVAVTVGKRALNDSRVLGSLWMLPIRDLIAVAIWFVSFFGNTIEWRGERFRVRDGTLAPVEPHR
jgi:ceramide glucosyltransferase